MKVKLIRMGKGNFKNIKIPLSFSENPPKPEKLIHKVLVFARESELEDILIDEDFNLVDGYCSYLIAQQVGTQFVKIKQVKRC